MPENIPPAKETLGKKRFESTKSGMRETTLSLDWRAKASAERIGSFEGIGAACHYRIEPVSLLLIAGRAADSHFLGRAGQLLPSCLAA